MDFLNDQLEDRGLIINPEDGELLTFGNSSVRLQITSEDTNDQFGVYNIYLEAGAEGAKLHYHRFMDETFIINEGIVLVELGKRIHHAKPGSLVYVPRFTPHAFRNEQKVPASITLIFNPAQRREGFFMGLQQVLNSDPVKAEDFLKLYHKYDSYPIEDA